MNKPLTKNKNDDLKRRHADLRLQMEERLKHLLQVDLNYCACHSARFQQSKYTIKGTTVGNSLDGKYKVHDVVQH